MTQTSPKPPNEPESLDDINHNRLSDKIEALKPKVQLDKNLPTQDEGRWLYNLPIRTKQYVTLLISEILSVVGLVGIAGYLIVSGGRAQLLNQATSELVVTEINYNIKIDQMGFGFRGQSDNTAIINAAKNNDQGLPLEPELINQVKEILFNEIRARKIEYATLVGTDLRIIANANNNRKGEIFNPNSLVSTVINNGRQIKTSAIVTWEELSKENPLLPANVNEKDVLIRYTVTPVKDPATGRVVGVLVSGDIVDGKYTIVDKTVEAFEGGYSGIYKYDNGQFDLAITKHIPEGNNAQQGLPNIALTNNELLQKAIEAQGEPVTGRGTIAGNQTYTLAAQSINNHQGEPVAILVRGTSEQALNSLLRNNLRLQILIAGLAIIADIILAKILGKVIADRIEKLQENAEKFAQGDRQVRTEVIGKDELGNLAQSFNLMAENISTYEGDLRQDTEESKVLATITSKSSLDVEEIKQGFDKSINKARRLLKVDRVVVYRLNPDWSGYIAHEAIEGGWARALNEQIEDPCIPYELREAYKKGRVVATTDVMSAGFHPDHLQLLERLEVKANLVVPIINQEQLYGLLIAHHCAKTHEWQEREIQFLQKMAIQLGITLERYSLFIQEQVQARRNRELKNITLKLTNCIDQESIINIAPAEIRSVLRADRVIIYRFDENWQGTVIAESVDSTWPIALGATIADPCFAQEYVDRYKQGRVQATPDIYNAGLTECYLQQLEPFAVRANLVAPILVKGELLGLLIAHQCSTPRNWEQGEINLFAQLSTQVGLALDKAELLEKQRMSELEQRRAKEEIQKRALELLMEVEPVSQGDLTIRAKVTADEVGTIADSYNATVENLRKIVSQVQVAAQQVAVTTTNNETYVSELQKEAEHQAEDISEALDRIQAMTESIRTVAANAEEAELAVRQAAESVESGDEAMNRTVEGILAIKDTVTETEEKVRNLGESTEKISKVINLIGKFAAQTHLLALKASIEAARAGEEGQGFAVIADEVRSLAAQSAEATADIESLVTEIQNATKQVVIAMETGREQVVTGSNLVEDTRKTLNQITAASSKINQLVLEISTSAVEQYQASEAISDTMTDVAAIASNTSSSITNVSGSFQELLALAQELQENTAKFKVK